MIEVVEDLWSPYFEWRAITTNGIVRRDGALVMGRGVALQAAQRYPDLPKRLGGLRRFKGNVPAAIPEYGIVTFPVKHHWRDKADLDLLRRSAEVIRMLWDAYAYGPVAIPRPGCGNGGLTWNQVRPILEPYFDDDRFVIVSQ